MSVPVRILGLAVSAVVLTPGVGRAVALDLRKDGVELAVRTTAAEPNAPVIGGQADFNAQLESLKAQAQVGFGMGQKAADARTGLLNLPADDFGRWESQRFSLGAVWTPWSPVKVELSSNREARREFSRGDPLWTGSPGQQLQSQQWTTRIAATFSPVSPLSLQVGGQSSDTLLSTAAVSLAGSAAADSLHTQTQRATTTLSWRPFRQLSLEGGAQTETMRVSWEGEGSRLGTYVFAEPRAAATLTPWTGASGRFSVERAVSPLNTDQFVSLARTEPASTVAAFSPNQEWRYEAVLQQRLGRAVDLNGKVTWARLQNVTDFGPMGVVQAPQDIGEGARSQIEAGVSAPVALFGLRALSLNARAAVRDSRVVDPFTRSQRRLSGESAYDARLALVGAAGSQFRWGVAVQGNGPSSVYQMSQVTVRSPTAGLGGFVEYNPGPMSVRLDLDNVVGGDQVTRDLFYAGSRELNQLERVDESRNGSAAVRLMLRKPL